MSRNALILAVPLVALLAIGCSSKDTETEYVTGPSPSITSVNPTEVTSAETVLLTITGANFETGAAVFLEDLPADSVTVISPSALTARFTIPVTMGPGAIDVEVVNPDGQIARARDAVTIPGAPVVTGVSPYGGPVGGGTDVTLTGTGFKSGAIVLVEGEPATNVTYVSGTSITCTTPVSTLPTPNQDGLATVTVKNPDGKAGSLYDDSATTATARGFLYSLAPTVTNVAPDNGAQAGGTAVTITGTGFHRTIAAGGEADADATVTFGGTAATNVTVVSDTEISCDTPAAAAGAVDVVVTNPDGQDNSAAPGTFTYNAMPVVESVNPGAVYAAGTVVFTSGSDTVTGTNTDWTTSPVAAGWFIRLHGTTGVYTVQSVDSDTQITLTANVAAGDAGSGTYTASQGTAVAGSGGGMNMTVSGPAGGSHYLSGANVYVGQTDKTGTAAFQAGSTTVTGTGTAWATSGVAAGWVIRLDWNASYYVVASVDSDTQITLTAAVASGDDGTGHYTAAEATFENMAYAGVPDTVTGDVPGMAVDFYDVTLVNPDGQSDTWGPSQGDTGLEYQPGPTVDSVVPGYGPVAGGTSVTITGSNFDTTNGVNVGFGTEWVNGVTPTSATSITVTTPPANGQIGPVTVYVTNIGSGLPGQLANGFIYVSGTLPDITSVDTAQGPLAGGTAFTNVNGSGFLDGTRIYVGAVETVGDADFTAGSATVTGTGTNWSTTGVIQPGWKIQIIGMTGTYEVASVDSDTQITLTTNVAAGDARQRWLYTAFEIECGSYDYGVGLPTLMDAVTPDITTISWGPGPRDLVAVNPDNNVEDGTGGYTQFLFTGAAPTVTAINPDNGPMAGGQSVTITGTNFWGLSNGATAEPTVTFAGAVGPATAVTVTDSTTLTCTTPQHTLPGPVQVTVTNVDSQSGSLPATPSPPGYMYNALSAPVVTDVNGTTPWHAGVSGQTVTVNGSDFYSNSTVTLGGIDVTGSVTFPAGPGPHGSFQLVLPLANTMPGLHNNPVVVTNADTQASGNGVGVHYRPNPSAPVPSSGPANQATTITISCPDGSFEAGVTASIGGQPCQNYTRNIPDSFTCDTPNSLTGVQTVVVENPTIPLSDINGHTFSFGGNRRFWELTSVSDFAQQANNGADIWGSLGDVQLPRGPGGHFSCGDIVTCVTYFKGGSTPTDQTVLVGTAASGAFLGTQVGTVGESWTSFNRLTRSNFPSDHITCAAFWNHATASGSHFMIGTNRGVAITTDGGVSFTVLNNSTTPELRVNYVYDVDYCDGIANNPNHMLIATADPGGGNGDGGTTHIDGTPWASNWQWYQQNNMNGTGFEDSNRHTSADFLDTDGSTFILAIHGPTGAGRGCGAITTDGGGTFSVTRPGAWGNEAEVFVARYCQADATGSTYILGSTDAAEGAYIHDATTPWTAITLPVNVSTDAAFYDATSWMVSTPQGVSITTDTGGTYDTIATASTGGYDTISEDLCRSVDWHTTIGNANSFLIACGRKNANVVTGAMELTTDGGTTFVPFAGDPGLSNHLAQPPAVLPTADVTDVAFSNASSNVYLVGTRNGAAFYDGTSWRWCNMANNLNIPSDNIQNVALYEAAGPTYYILLGTDQGLAYSNDGGSTFTDETGNFPAFPQGGSNSTDIRGVAFFDGTHYACCTVRLGGGPNGGRVYFNDNGNWYAAGGGNNGITEDDFRDIDLFRGTASMEWVIIGTNGNGVIVGQYHPTTPSYTVYAGGGVLPGDTVNSVAFDQGSPTSTTPGPPTDLRAVVGTTAGGARATGLEGTPTWTQYTTGSTPALVSNNVADCAYGKADGSGNYFMFATDSGVQYTTDAWATAGNLTRVTPVSSPDRTKRFVISACAYYDGAGAGDRMLWASPAQNESDTGGVVLRAGLTYAPAAGLTVQDADGLLLPAPVGTPSLPDKNIRGICWNNGGGNTHFIVSTDYGIAFTTDGGQTFTPIRENRPAAGSLPWNRVTCVAVHEQSPTAANPTMLVGILGGGAALKPDNSNSWTPININAVPWSVGPNLPSNNVNWVAFHDGAGTAPNNLTYLICTDAGTVYIKNGQYIMTFDNSVSVGGDSVDNDQFCADFDDLDTAGTYTFLITACAGGGGSGGGIYRTMDDGSTWDRWYDDTPTTNQSSYKCTTGYFYGTQTGNSDTWFMGAYPGLVGSGFNGSICRTTNGDDPTASNVTFDQWIPDGRLDEDCRYFSICDSTASPSHWMAVAPGQGVDVTTNGNLAQANVTFTAYDNTNGLASNNILSCAYWSGAGAAGNIWAVGTDAGLSLTTDGGGNLKPLRRSEYSTGTVTYNSGSPTVTGSGTSWTTSGIRQGWRIVLGAGTYVVSSVDSDTQITLMSNASASATGANYLAYTAPTGYFHLEVNETIPANTQIAYDILDGSGGVLLANQTTGTVGGPTTAQIDLSSLDYYTNPTIQVRVKLTTGNSSATPVLHWMRIEFIYP